MNTGDVATVAGETVVVIQTSPEDGWIQVRYPDGDVVWTPPEAVKTVTEEVRK